MRINVRKEMGQKGVFGSGLTLRMTESGQYIKKGEVNWVQPFKPKLLEGFFCFTPVFGVWCLVFSMTYVTLYQFVSILNTKY